MRKKLTILGSTGSIGTKALDVVRAFPQDFEVAALAARSNIDLLEKQAKEFSPRLIAVFDEAQAQKLRKRVPHLPILCGMEGIVAAARFEEAHFALLAMTGSAGLLPALEAIEAGKQIGIANKEAFVCAGELLSQKAKEKSVQLIPVDSELSALFQCLKGENRSEVKRLILTASGGPFRKKGVEELKQVSLKEALSHPNYRMGPKVSIDSSTLMNKGLEMIEARWLFDMAPEKIEAIIHPQQKIHSLVEFIDGSILAQISESDMILPIQYAMSYPKRSPALLAPYDFTKNNVLEFFSPNTDLFRCLSLAIEALKIGKSYPCYLNAANEVLVERFLKENISWIEIGTKLEKLISSHIPQNLLTLEAILEVDAMARKQASKV